MNKLFLDSDVLLDLLLDRQPFSNDIADIIEYAFKNKISLYTSAVSITNINYIVGKIENKMAADTKTQKILQLIKIENVGQKVIDKASKSTIKDFEDAVQNFCAIEANHTILVTRNTKDFKNSTLAILNPKEYIAKMLSE